MSDICHVELELCLVVAKRTGYTRGVRVMSGGCEEDRLYITRRVL